MPGGKVMSLENDEWKRLNCHHPGKRFDGEACQKCLEVAKHTNCDLIFVQSGKIYLFFENKRKIKNEDKK